MCDCDVKETISYVLGILFFIGSVASYIPQCISLLKAQTPQGVNELSIFFLNVAFFCLSLNTIIVNLNLFKCFCDCDIGLSFMNLLSVYQILASWMMSTLIYVLLLRFRCKCCGVTCGGGAFRNNLRQKFKKEFIQNENDLELEDEIGLEDENVFDDYKDVEFFEGSLFRPCFDWMLFLLYIGFILFFILFLSIENDPKFMKVFSWIMGILSAVITSIVWIPQIYSLWRYKNFENLSIIMFLMQSFGSLLTVAFQIFIYPQPVSTWIGYAISSFEQFIILGTILFLSCKTEK